MPSCSGQVPSLLTIVPLTIGDRVVGEFVVRLGQTD